ncbi:MAG: hypothetical protein G01um101477_271 [Candidatus Doudnabacteria bacterium Gr01-1014_77]|uniref:Uncharacterized protein n=1 Tax=Candidatus Doudnabacteria bacterium Gr01-1014_77 TaxID=2017133 RepID=A0A554JC59_9BACT|nr:MAG: hypothetical protein G01um101477_271 [Candidatus Doudnabacteria bacterium Gr01-1014_77]
MKLKKLFLSFGTVIFSGLGWYLFSRIFDGSNIFRGNSWNWFGFIFSLGLAYAFSFLIAATRDRFDFEVTSLLSVLWIPVFLGTTGRNIIAAIVLFLFSQALLEFASALEHSIDLNYFTTAYSKIALVIIALLAITSIYFQDRVVANVGNTAASQKAVGAIWPYVSKYFNQYNTNGTVNEFLVSEFTQQGVQQPTPQMIATARNELSKQLNLNLNGKESMSSLGEDFVANQFNDFLQEYHIEKSGIYVIFLSLLVLWPIGRLLYALIALLVFKIFESSGLIKIKETQVTAKTLQM